MPTYINNNYHCIISCYTNVVDILDVNTLIASGGLLLIAFLVFAESGLLFGFFFPGDTLLFAAGIFAYQGHFSLWLVIGIVICCAIAGGRVGYWIGQKTGPKLFKKEDGILFRREYIEKAENFYEKHGGKTILLARFIPVVRTFAPVVAGVGNMSLPSFNFYNILGSGIWAISVTVLGYFFGSKIPNIDAFILPIILTVTLITFSSPAYSIMKDQKARKKLQNKLKNIRYFFK